MYPYGYFSCKLSIPGTGSSITNGKYKATVEMNQWYETKRRKYESQKGELKGEKYQTRK